MPQYVGYDPWTDAANYGAGLGQSLTQAFQQMPAQRLQLAMGLAQNQARTQALNAQMQRQQAMEQQNEALRKVQLQEALARTAAAQAEVTKAGQQPQLKPKDQVEIIKGEGGIPLGYFDYSTKRYVAFGGGGGTNQPGLVQLPPPGANNQPIAGLGSPSVNDVKSIIGLGNLLSNMQSNGMNTNSPSLYGGISNQLAQILSPRAVTPQLGATNAPPSLGATNQPAFGTSSQITDTNQINSLIQEANSAIARGANPMAVSNRLKQQYGIDTQ